MVNSRGNFKWNLYWLKTYFQLHILISCNEMDSNRNPRICHSLGLELIKDIYSCMFAVWVVFNKATNSTLLNRCSICLLQIQVPLILRFILPPLTLVVFIFGLFIRHLIAIIIISIIIVVGKYLADNIQDSSSAFTKSSSLIEATSSFDKQKHFLRSLCNNNRN